MPRRTTLFPAQVNPFHQVESLCWTCSRATGCDCPFFFEKDPLAGLEAAGATAYTLETKEGPLFKVVRCLKYRKGKLRKKA
ncbi:MAG: hypothetical protein K6U04_06815 [Armatimonadetes bacterium]|nr:hypothetical protein [Armatimonadota bacterium]